jgi:hypothetical protein
MHLRSRAARQNLRSPAFCFNPYVAVFVADLYLDVDLDVCEIAARAPGRLVLSMVISRVQRYTERRTSFAVAFASPGLYSPSPIPGYESRPGRLGFGAAWWITCLWL